ncbi:caspase family protein (plasmid) [Streptomyces mirabilis]|uniref:Caspase family protein n=2 Tax=Streptomyces mirabilis TaxID=68239 RepID=A0ABU3V696_9ACTN|nr:caspase family protein [Streptomyces mirabilis]MDU9001687.1 caspase family protein [Streptomyces mirabilis]
MTLGTDRIDRSGSHAVLIGVSAYQDPSFPSVPAAKRSMQGVHGMLIDEELGGWSTDQITPILNPIDCRRVMSDLRRHAQNTHGVLLLYFVGHGTVTMNGDLVLAVSDTLADEPDVTGLEYSKIRSVLLGSPAKVKAVVLDCCYSGRAIDVLAGDRQHLADITDVRGTYTLTAADRTAHAGQADTYTAFTGELLDLIGAGVADGPPVLTFAELYPHLRHRLIARNLPHPNQRGTDTADQCPVAKNASVKTPTAGQAASPARLGAPAHAVDVAPPAQLKRPDTATAADLSTKTRLPSSVGSREVSSPQLKALAGGDASRAKLPAHRRGIRRRDLMLSTLAVAGTGVATATVIRLHSGSAGTAKTTSKISGEGTGTVLFSPDGKTLATCGNEGFRLRDSATGRSIALLSDQDRPGNLAFSPDGRTLATGGIDGIRLRDPATGVITVDLQSDHSVTGLAFSPDGNTLAGGVGLDAYGSKGIRLWSVAKGGTKATFTVPLNEQAIHALVFSPDGRNLVGGSAFADEGRCWLWEVATGRISATVLKESTISAAFSPDGKTFATGGVHGVRLWTTRTVRAVSTFTGDYTASVAFGPYGSTLVTGGVGGVRVWDVATGRLISRLTENDTDTVAVSPDGQVVASGSIGQGFGVSESPTESRESGFWLWKHPASAPILTSRSSAHVGPHRA